jgi:hypothetical protein
MRRGFGVYFGVCVCVCVCVCVGVRTHASPPAAASDVRQRTDKTEHSRAPLALGMQCALGRVGSGPHALCRRERFARGGNRGQPRINITDQMHRRAKKSRRHTASPPSVFALFPQYCIPAFLSFCVSVFSLVPGGSWVGRVGPAAVRVSAPWVLALAAFVCAVLLGGDSRCVSRDHTCRAFGAHKTAQTAL